MSSEVDSEQIDDLKKRLKESIDEMQDSDILALSQQLHIQLGSWSHGYSNVICALQNNPKLISSADADQCPGCGEFFCKEHKLDFCTHCKHRI